MERGQASLDYVGVVALVALTLTAAGTLAAPDLPKTVARHVRVGLCIVGGDICRAGDARRAGLEPCVVRVREGDAHTRGSITVFSVAAGKAFSIERRSDGSARVALTTDAEGGLSAAAGLRLGADVDVGADLSGAIGWRSGSAWELPDEAALARFLDGIGQDPHSIVSALRRRGVARPTERFHAVTESMGAEAGASILDLDVPLVSAGGRGAIGRRTGGGRSSWYFDARHEGPHLFGGLIPEIELGRGRGWVLELRDAPRELRVTAALPDGVEIEGRLDLTTPANAAVVRALLTRPTPERADAVGRHIAAHGTVERRTYRVRVLPSDPELALKLGIAGVQHRGSAQERTLVSAEVLRGTGNLRRADCLGL